MGLLDNLFKKSNQDQPKVTKSDSAPKIKLEELTQKEKDFVETNAKVATDFLESYNIDFNPSRLHPDNIAGFSYHWFEKGLKGDTPLSDDQFSNCMAGGWGQYLHETYGMSWKVITDEFGTSIGLYHPTNEVTVFPFASMSKAIKNKNYEMICSITDHLGEALKAK